MSAKEALEAAKGQLPTWRGQNEQSMALAAIGFAKAKLRRQIMVAATSIGPGALNESADLKAKARAKKLRSLLLRVVTVNTKGHRSTLTRVRIKEFLV